MSIKIFGRAAMIAALVGAATAIVPATAASAASAAHAAVVPSVIVEPDSVITYREGTGFAFTIRLSQPPPGTVYAAFSISGGLSFATTPNLHVFTPQNWNIPQTRSLYSLSEDGNTVDNWSVATVRVDGYASDSVTLHQIDRG